MSVARRDWRKGTSTSCAMVALNGAGPPAHPPWTVAPPPQAAGPPPLSRGLCFFPICPRAALPRFCRLGQKSSRYATLTDGIENFGRGGCCCFESTPPPIATLPRRGTHKTYRPPRPAGSFTGQLDRISRSLPSTPISARIQLSVPQDLHLPPKRGSSGGYLCR